MEVKDIHILTPKNFCFQNKEKLFVFNKVHPNNIDKTLFTDIVKDISHMFDVEKSNLKCSPKKIVDIGKGTRYICHGNRKDPLGKGVNVYKHKFRSEPNYKCWQNNMNRMVDLMNNAAKYSIPGMDIMNKKYIFL